VVAVLFLLGLSWVLGAAPSSSADEDSHYIRMVGLSRGDVVGRDVPIDTPADGYTRHSGRQLQRLNVESGIYHLSPGELPADPCNRFRPAQPFVCAPRTPSATNEIRSYHARTLPMSYVIPALLSRLGTGTASKLVLGRLGFLVQACALLVVAFVACGRWLRRSPWAVGCVLTAMTPLAVYEFGVLAPSGTEFAAVVSFTAALWRALHDDEPRWWWLASALGAVAVLSRDTGLVLTVLSAAAFGLIQLAMVLTAARRSARGLDGLNLSLRGSLWTPPVGWAVVLAVAALGAIGVGALAWTNRADEPGEPRLPATGAATGRMRPRRVR
jgi:hypothetical protein